MTIQKQTIGRYQIEDSIGQGGMATVYRALDTELQREVALKLLPAHVTNNHEFTQRFQREARIVAQLEHARIVPIYDVGEMEGRPYLVMRLLRGGTLRDKMATQSLETSQLLTALSYVAQALDVAHRHDIIHRDIKPTNILFDEHSEAFLADFGVAKVAEATTDLTGTQTIGTPAYMSPEQFTGDPIDGRSDQYSLAVVAYEALTGKPPFVGNTMQVMYQHVHDSPPFPTLPHEALPKRVTAVLQRALSKNKEERYTITTAFITALQAEYKQAPARHKTTAVIPLASSSEPHTPQHPMPVQRPARRSQSGKRKPKPSRTPKPITNRIQPGAGGVIAQPKSKRPIWLGLGSIIVVALLLGGGWLLMGTSWASDDSTVNNSDPLLLPEDPSLPVALLIGDFEDGILQQGETLNRLPESGEVMFKTGEQNLLQSGRGRFQIVLPDRTAVYLDRNTAVEIQKINGVDNAAQTTLRLQEGLIIVDPPAGQTQVVIENDYGAKALTDAGVMGISQVGENFTASCLSGTCSVVGDVDGVMTLQEGELTNIGVSGRPSAPTQADYATYALIADVVTTPTPQADTPPSEDSILASTSTESEASEVMASEIEVVTETPIPTATSPPSTSTTTPNIQPTSANSTGAASTGEGLPLDFSNIGVWVRGDEENGSFSGTTQQAYSGSQSGKLDYSFATANNDYVVFMQLNDIAGQPTGIQAQVLGDGSGHYFNIWIQDNEGQTWQVPLGRVTHTGWKLMSGDIDPSQTWPWTHISGPRDDEVDYPIRFRGLVLDDVDDAYTGEGTIYVDDIVAVAGTTVQNTSTPAPNATIATIAAPATSIGSLATVTSTPLPSDPGELGRILYTSGRSLLTTDPDWNTPIEVGTFASNTCGSPATTVAGQSYRLYFSPKCSVGEGTTICTSPNGATEVIFNGSFNDGFTISVRRAGTEGTGTYIYEGKDIDLDEGIRWSPISNGFLFILQDTVHIGYPTGGYDQIIPTAYSPNFSSDGSMILYRKPIGPGVNDIFVANADGTGARNVTNVSAIDKQCPAWLLP